jgi:hypothetical protein
MEDGIKAVKKRLDLFRVQQIGPAEFERCRLPRAFEKFQSPCGEVVDSPYRVSVPQQLIGQITPDKTRGSRNNRVHGLSKAANLANRSIILEE